jgi:signal transduction histidine kinase
MELFQRQPSLLPSEDESEFGQTKVRLAILVIVCAYTGFFGATFTPTFTLAPWAQVILLYYVFYTPCALAIFLWARAKRGHYPIRRLAAMLLDYGSLGFSLIVEPTAMMPLHTVILWITMGNGLRYGKRYLWIAMGFAAVTYGFIWAMTPMRTDAPFLLITLTLSVIAIPQYASALLKRVEQARQEAEAANLAKSRFLAQASHDLRQPLHAINLFLVSLQQTGLSGAQQTITDRIDRSLQSVARLFRSLLDLSTLDSGAIQPKLIALDELLTDIVQQNAQLAAWSDTDLRLVSSKAIILTDRALLTTMIQNLLSNALKFSNGRAVLIGCRRSKATVSIQILDQGVGIADEHIPFLFDEFYQIKVAGDPDRQGVGLGLSIVARMAKLLGLKVDIRSEVERGTCFTISGLQVLRGASTIQATRPNFGGGSPLTNLRVLLVEDDIDILAATEDLLKSWGCVTIARTTIPDAPVQIDLILTDYDLGGGVTGADCISKVRLAAGWNVPAIIITGHDDSRISDALNDTDIPVIKKPVRPAELRSSLGAARALLLHQKSLRPPDSPFL